MNKKVTSIKKEPVKVINLKIFKNELSVRLQELRCTACNDKIGERGWGMAWVEMENGKKRGMRLCYDCVIDAGGKFVE